MASKLIETGCKPHAIMIALPYQGHITPFVNLALKLASNDFTITFVHLEFIHKMLSEAHSTNETETDLFSNARESGLDIRYTTIHDGFPLEFDRALHYEEYWVAMVRDFPSHVDEFVRKIVEFEPFLDHFLITDTTYTWPATIAKKYDIVNVSFWTEPALVFSLSYHVDLLMRNNHFACKENIMEDINYIPGVDSLSTSDLMSYFKEPGSEALEKTVVLKAFEEVKKADFILHNTVQQLESKTLSSLTRIQPNYAIGPINFSKNITKIVTNNLRPGGSDYASWLDSKPPNSVLYVSFGSFIKTSKEVLEEIAYGLLLSEVNFIWVVRTDSVSLAGNEALPVGFIDEVKDKGLIVPWCDQITVLSNRAVGGFLTHCGWNSVLESMWCGVPMICYPLMYDQPTNRKLVVDDWKVGINLCNGASIDRNEVAEKIKALMSERISKGLREEAKRVKGVLKHAVEVNGSLEKNFEQFIKDLKAKIHSKKELASDSSFF